MESGGDQFVVATKYVINMRKGDPNAGGNHRKSLVQSVEASLKRLKTDYIDLYWLHCWEYRTPIEEVMRALDDLVQAGKVLYLAISNTPAGKVAQGNTIADFRGWTPFIALQQLTPHTSSCHELHTPERMKKFFSSCLPCYFQARWYCLAV